MTNRALTAQDAVSVDDVDCLFCRFDDDSINSIVTESENFYARWDNYPVADGHVEVVPKTHVISFFDLSPDDVREAYELMRTVQKLVNEKFEPQGYTIGVNDGRAAGRTIDHLHIHLIPRYTGDVPDPRGGIRQIIPGDDPSQWSEQNN